MIQLTNKADCCGCTACVNICTHQAISLKTDTEGFLYPTVNMSLCTNCNLCDKVCPIIARKNTNNQANQKALFAARHKDNEILLNSASGGAFSALATIVLNRGGVICGVEYSSSMEVRHAFAESFEEYKRFADGKPLMHEVTEKILMTH